MSELATKEIPAPVKVLGAELRGNMRRARIIETARRLFFENGYQGTSMSMISAQLGGSKSTLYAYYRSKKELFRAIIQSQCEEMTGHLRVDLRADGELKKVLLGLANWLIDMLLRESTMLTLLLVASESRQAPELAKIFDSAGPAITKLQLTNILTDAAALRELSIPDANIAANHFVALCKGELWFYRLLNLKDPPKPDEIAIHAEQVVTMFMSAYRTKNPEQCA